MPMVLILIDHILFYSGIAGALAAGDISQNQRDAAAEFFMP